MPPRLVRNLPVYLVLAAFCALAGFAAGLQTPGVHADEAGGADSTVQSDAAHSEAGEVLAEAPDGSGQVDAAPALDGHRPVYPGYPCYPYPCRRIIIVVPGYPCHPYPCVGYPWPYPCYDPNFPPFPELPVPPAGTPGATVVPPAPGATAVPPTPYPVPSPTPGGQAQGLNYRVCPQVINQIPQHIQDLATSEPWRYYGYGIRRNPNTPYHPLWNTYRTWLSLRDTALPYSPCNLPQWKSGCP